MREKQLQNEKKDLELIERQAKLGWINNEIVLTSF
jgi:hypothetical protein